MKRFECIYKRSRVPVVSRACRRASYNENTRYLQWLNNFLRVIPIETNSSSQNITIRVHNGKDWCLIGLLAVIVSDLVGKSKLYAVRIARSLSSCLYKKFYYYYYYYYAKLLFCCICQWLSCVRINNQDVHKWIA